MDELHTAEGNAAQPTAAHQQPRIFTHIILADDTSTQACQPTAALAGDSCSAAGIGECWHTFSAGTSFHTGLIPSSAANLVQYHGSQGVLRSISFLRADSSTCVVLPRDLSFSSNSTAFNNEGEDPDCFTVTYDEEADADHKLQSGSLFPSAVDTPPCATPPCATAAGLEPHAQLHSQPTHLLAGFPRVRRAVRCTPKRSRSQVVVRTSGEPSTVSDPQLLTPQRLSPSHRQLQLPSGQRQLLTGLPAQGHMQGRWVAAGWQQQQQPHQEPQPPQQQQQQQLRQHIPRRRPVRRGSLQHIRTLDQPLLLKWSEEEALGGMANAARVLVLEMAAVGVMTGAQGALASPTQVRPAAAQPGGLERAPWTARPHLAKVCGAPHGLAHPRPGTGLGVAAAAPVALDMGAVAKSVTMPSPHRTAAPRQSGAKAGLGAVWAVDGGAGAVDVPVGSAVLSNDWAGALGEPDSPLPLGWL